MGFKKTSEGRVFFKSADNDDLPASPINAPSDSLMSKDSAQVQILLLLKTLNEKLQESRDDNAAMKKTLDAYKTKINVLEERTLAQQSDYIDLEQKVAAKQSEVNKKASRVENSMKTTLKKLEDARELVKALEEKSEEQDSTLETIKKDIEEKDEKSGDNTEEIAKIQKKLLDKHKKLETLQKEQGEKLASNVSSYVSLTKRISQTETRQDELDNKIEETASENIKLDRKIDKVIDDRNRILRKIERIEGAVIETRDALNAKAMVLLTDQGAVAGVNVPDNIANNAALSNDPMMLKRQIEEEAMMPWWRRPIRIQTTSLFLLLVVVMLLGWIMSAVNAPVGSNMNVSPHNIATPTVTLGASKTRYEAQDPSEDVFYDIDESGNAIYDDGDYRFSQNVNPEPDFSLSYNESPEIVDPTANNNATEHDVIIHKGYAHPSEIKKKAKLDVHDDKQMLLAMQKDPERVAVTLNEIEPGNAVEKTVKKAPKKPKKKAVKQTYSPPPTPAAPRIVSETYKATLRKRISRDQGLTDTAQKIEAKAFEGVPEAQHDMGAIYVAGRGKIKQNLERAVFWFREAANNGVANAKYNLGVLYHQGVGVKANMDKAIHLYEEAAYLGHPEAQYNLGIANIEGIGVAYNPGNAARYFEGAAQQGVVEAAYNLGLIYENGLLGEAQPDIALTWYKNAADAGSPEAKSAMRQLASSIGVGVEDITRIIENVKRSHTSFANAHDKQSLISSTQSELMRRGLYPGPVDGMLGPMTRKAIENFQRSANLHADGNPSIELLQYLKASTNYSQYQ